MTQETKRYSLMLTLELDTPPDDARLQALSNALVESLQPLQVGEIVIDYHGESTLTDDGIVILGMDEEAQ